MPRLGKRFLVAFIPLIARTAGIAFSFRSDCNLEAATVIVDQGGAGDFRQIQEAIDAAKDGGTVVVLPGEYAVAEPVHLNALRDPGDPGPGAVKDIEIRSRDGPTVTVIRFAGSSSAGHEILRSVVAFQAGESSASRIEGFTLTGASNGAGIYCFDASTSVENCVIVENGLAGLISEGGAPRFGNCIVARNRLGGVSLSNSAAMLVSCRITENLDSGVSARAGASELIGCTMSANVAQFGAGLNCGAESNLEARDCIFEGNMSTNFGGGVYSQGRAVLTNCLIVGNSAENLGGAVIVNAQGSIRLVNCTIAENFAFGRGQGGLTCLNGGTSRMVNSIVSGNFPASTWGSIASSLLEDQDPSFVKRGTFDFLRFKEVLAGNQTLRLPDFILEPGDYSLRDRSPAIDSADPAAAPARDLAGRPRPCIAAPDIGAFEYCPPPVTDCNRNGIDDAEDIGRGSSSDCNSNDVPDECDLEVEDVDLSRVTSDYSPEVISMAAADLDGDGDTDLAVNTRLTVLEVIKNNDRDFSEVVTTATSYDHVHLAAGDLDGDGDNDIVSTSRVRPVVNFFRNAGSGGFSSPGGPVTYGIGGIGTSLFLADLDHDGDVDIAASSNPPSAPESEGTISVLLNRARGVIGTRRDYAAGVHPATLLMLDATGDGLPDLALANLGSADGAGAGIRVLVNRGEGVFEQFTDFPVDPGPEGFAAGDLDGDGDTDLAVTNKKMGSISIYWHTDDGSFQRGLDLPLNSVPLHLAATDLNLDGLTDLVASREGAASVSIFTSRGRGAFSGAREEFVGAPPILMQISDLEGDKRPDVFLALQGRFAILMNWTPPPRSQDYNHNSVPDECERRAFLRGDSNTDGKLDISDPICILQFLFIENATRCGSGSNGLSCLEAADLTNDGALDLTDAVFLLAHLFQDSRPIPLPGGPPGPCGFDPDPLGSRASLSCDRYPGC